MACDARNAGARGREIHGPRKGSQLVMWEERKYGMCLFCKERTVSIGLAVNCTSPHSSTCSSIFPAKAKIKIWVACCRTLSSNNLVPRGWSDNVNESEPRLRTVSSLLASCLSRERVSECVSTKDLIVSTQVRETRENLRSHKRTRKFDELAKIRAVVV